MMETHCDTCRLYTKCDEIYECDDCQTKARELQEATRRECSLMRENLTATQARCTALFEENRRLRGIVPLYQDDGELHDALANGARLSVGDSVNVHSHRRGTETWTLIRCEAYGTELQFEFEIGGAAQKPFVTLSVRRA